jgi:S-(hydroxymethyl)glutathione dehydrogenase / alcohol dehydrogenase
MLAAVVRVAGDGPVDIIETLELSEIVAGMVRVKVCATGVCHSDLSVATGVMPHPMPTVLGHEGSGYVLEVGPGIDDLSVGDHVVSSFGPPCGRCIRCLNGQGFVCTRVRTSFAGIRPYRSGSEEFVGIAGVGALSEEMLVPREALVRIPKDIPFHIACLIGCGVTTGVGAAINAAKVQPGSSVLVFGCGGIGISIIQGSKICGAATIVAVDPSEERRVAAIRFGATSHASPDELPRCIAETNDGEGFDYAFDAAGKPVTTRAAYDAVRRGGTACVVGIGRADETVTFSLLEIAPSAKQLIGSVNGNCDIRAEYGKLLNLWRSGRLDLEGMVTSRVDISGVNGAFEDMKSGRGIRTVIDF